MEPTTPYRKLFLHDKDNRVQNLYYDIEIKTIFIRTKLQNVKKKFWKYAKFLAKVYIEIIQPRMLEFGCIRDNAYCDWQRAKRKSYTNNSSEKKNEEIRMSSIYHEADDEYEEMVLESQLYDENIRLVQDKIKEINNHQKDIMYYKKCAHCETMKNVTTAECSLKHKLCYDCIHDKTECPVCDEDMGLFHCDICYRYKKELVDTGCKNKHQTCKVCLVKIIRKNNLCPFCRDTCNKVPPSVVPIYVEGTHHTVEEMEQPYSDGRGRYMSYSR